MSTADDSKDALATALADRYELLREIGRGGMATVYLARDLQHNAQVAIKVLRPDIAMSAGGTRFTREIQITAGLQHPNIVTVLGSGEAAGMPYFVMPYIEGESLGHRLQRESRLPLAEAVRLAGEVAEGLAHAHAAGFVHRDIKPGNILLSHGHAMIADFGVAKALEMSAADRITESGFAVGTVTYMSPEQAGAQ
ncbi:MAG: serine/threonine-protein kinase, partial [Gemmatimonadota bacterium]